MEININNIKHGMTVLIDDKLYLVMDFQHVKPGRQPAFVKLKIKNLKNGAIIDRTFKTNIKLTQAHINKVDASYLYNSGNLYYFMNDDDYSQFEISKDTLNDKINYLKPNGKVIVEFYEGDIINVSLPEKLSFKIVETTEATKGNTATKATKDAVIETGLVIKVPLFISAGEEVTISTIDGKYASRS